ncbi:hypothetical protein BKA66DRAFT_405521 [Pyrenochaeta sp. MPI-SDFR-AT-0127]|nr:hypothetical protein BKA66DRAFT_405521 [Pyrenochaeta sp. MPI-SDFR-AT-0127]
MASKDPLAAQLQKLAYEALRDYFQAHEADVVEIEILPPAIQPPNGILMQDGLSLGIPKKILALAYMEARQQFFENKAATDRASVALQATKVMLLFDPEHLTAANFRKRRLLTLRDMNGPQSRANYHQTLQQELCFVNSILTSPLHRQSKSPTLWHHRLFMMRPLVLLELENASKAQEIAFWRSELAAVCKSGQQHPKNYYAWQYARKLMTSIKSPGINDDFARFVKDWCCKHPSDISGWSFLLFLVPGLQPVSKRQDLIKDVLNYAISLRAEQESLWVFIKMALVQELLDGGSVELLQMLQIYSRDLASSDQTSVVSRRVFNALSWVQTYGGLATGSCSPGWS